MSTFHLSQDLAFFHSLLTSSRFLHFFLF